MSEAFENLRTDLTEWEIGPYHGALPAPMQLRLKLDGEIVVEGEVETGFMYRGLEKTIESHVWQSATAFADHLDPEAAIFGELALCLAVEEIGNLIVPPRAQSIRIILCELSRISAHMAFMVRMSRAVGAETMFHYVLRDREKILDLFELLTGARFSHNFLRFGGVKDDVTEGFIERVHEACEVIRIRLKEYNDLLTFNHAFIKRTARVGILGPDLARAHGITGPNGRSSGSTLDARKQHPCCGYDKIDFEVPLSDPSIAEQGGGAHDRFLIRLREIAQSVEILKQVTDSIPTGEFESRKIDREFRIPVGEAYSRVESSRGLLGCHVASDGSLQPNRVQFRPPSVAHLAVLPELLVGIRLEDLPVLIASLDISVAEVDR